MSLAAMRCTVEALPSTPVARRRLELVERKGVGHPDTICDSLVEAVSVALNRLYLERIGTILHYNVDKALLVAGQCRKGFGWGEVVQPMELVVGDRATFRVDDAELPVAATVHQAVNDWIAAHLPHVRPEADLRVRVALAPGSAQLRDTLASGRRVPVANDTSGASGYAPLSPTEETVLAVERFLNSPELKARFPDTGQDVKVFGARSDERLALTIAMPLLCRAITSEQAYFIRKEEIRAALAQRFRSSPFTIDWTVNALDSSGRGADGVYLSLSGTSAEDADSGQVGRGNRVNGLIAFSRPTGGEAAPGKNPVAHTGKIYSVLSYRLAQLIHARLPPEAEVYVHLVSRIGDPVDRPWTGVQLVLPAGVTAGDVEPTVDEVVSTELERLADFQAELTRGEHPVC